MNSVAHRRHSILSAQLLTRLAGERGMALDDCLRGTGIDANALAHPSSEITAAQELQLIHNVHAALGHVPGLGLDAGLRYHLSYYGILGFAVLSSPTFRSAVEVTARYFDLSFGFTRVRLEPEGDDLHMIFDDSDLPEALRQFLVERDFAACANVAWEMRPGGFPARRAEFRFERPPDVWRYDRLCGVRPQFGGTRNAVLLAAENLDAPLPQANPLMARVAEEQCRQLLARRQVRSGLAGQIRDRLLASPADMPSIETVAAEMNMSERSLRRRMAEEETSFRALVDEVRRTLAEELLASSHMKLAEIAVRLGYTEPTAFIYAFKRWKGISPAAYRQSRLRSQAG